MGMSSDHSFIKTVFVREMAAQSILGSSSVTLETHNKPPTQYNEILIYFFHQDLVEGETTRLCIGETMCIPVTSMKTYVTCGKADNHGRHSGRACSPHCGLKTKKQRQKGPQVCRCASGQQTLSGHSLGKLHRHPTGCTICQSDHFLVTDPSTYTGLDDIQNTNIINNILQTAKVMR